MKDIIKAIFIVFLISTLTEAADVVTTTGYGYFENKSDGSKVEKFESAPGTYSGYDDDVVFVEVDSKEDLDKIFLDIKRSYEDERLVKLVDDKVEELKKADLRAQAITELKASGDLPANYSE